MLYPNAPAASLLVYMTESSPLHEAAPLIAFSTQVESRKLRQASLSAVAVELKVRPTMRI
jgi:hypothetical protein